MIIFKKYYKIIPLIFIYLVTFAVAIYFINELHQKQERQLEINKYLNELKILNLTIDNGIQKGVVKFNNDILSRSVLRMKVLLDTIDKIIFQEQIEELNIIKNSFYNKEYLVEDFKSYRSILNNSMSLIMEYHSKIHSMPPKHNELDKLLLVANELVHYYLNDELTYKNMMAIKNKMASVSQIDQDNELVIGILLHANVLVNILNEYESVSKELKEYNLDTLIVKFIDSVRADSDYIEHQQEKLLYFIVIVASLLFIVTVFGFFDEIKKSTKIEELQTMAQKRSRELQEYMSLLDKYVISSRTDTNGIILDVSSAFCDISGYSKDELIGKNHNIIRHPDMPKELFADLWKSIKNGKTWNAEIKNLSKNGDEYWVFATITPRLDENNKLIGYIAIRQDITDKKDAQNKQDQLVQQSRHAAMGEMIGMIAHQWRQPLSAISTIAGNIELTTVLGELKEDDIVPYMQEITELTLHLSSTVDDFRNFFKPNKEKSLVTTKSIIDDSLKLLIHLFKTNSVELDIKISELKFYTNENELKQVIINIIKNAIDELISKNQTDKKIFIRDYIDNDQIIIEIEDNAGGIPDDIIEKIFEPYFSTKSKNGTGLGLYMSKSIIEDHLHGILRACNSSSGAIFKIALPQNNI